MRHISSLLQGLARSLSVGKERNGGDGDDGKAAATAVLRTSGTLWGEGSETFAAVCSRRGEKGINQDCSIVCEGFGCEERSVLCGIFDGHGQWGHYVAKAVRKSLPPTLLRRWREAVTLASLIDGGEKRLCECQVDLWRQSYLAACAAVDEELRASRRLDAVHSGCTALSLVKHGDLLVVANVGDSRAVLATASPDDGGRLAAVQLTVDFKPNLPQERERIRECNGRVQCLADEPRVAAGQRGPRARHVARLRRLLRQGLRRHLSAGGDAPPDHRAGPLHHPRHRRGVGRCVERGGGADRGVGAGEGEGGEAARRVRRPRMEAQAAGHRRRRLLGDLPLLPLAAVLNTCTQQKRTRRRCRRR